MSETTVPTLEQLAQEMLDQFELATRKDGSRFYRLKEGRPDWMQDVCREAHDHGEMMPDDFRYEFIYDALVLLAAGDEHGEGIESHVYNRDLLRWVSSHAQRPGYCDEAMNQGLVDTDSFGTIKLIGWGEYQERQEVFAQVKGALEDRLQQIEDEADDESDDDDKDESEDDDA